MTRSLRGARPLPALLVVLLAPGCGDTGGGAAPGAAQAPAPPPGGPSGPGGGPGSNPAIKAAMVKLTKGPNSLTPVIGNELKETPPPWDKIQPQTKDYAETAASIVVETPTRGDKESWTRLATAYAESAAALDKAAQARDQAAASSAHARIANSCMECHRSHRAMGPGGRGGPGGPPGGGPPGSGPPPGGGPPPK